MDDKFSFGSFDEVFPEDKYVPSYSGRHTSYSGKEYTSETDSYSSVGNEYDQVCEPFFEERGNRQNRNEGSDYISDTRKGTFRGGNPSFFDRAADGSNVKINKDQQNKIDEYRTILGSKNDEIGFKEARTGFVLSCSSFVLSIMFFMGLISLLLGIAGIHFRKKSEKLRNESGYKSLELNNASRILAIIALVISVLELLAPLFFVVLAILSELMT